MKIKKLFTRTDKLFKDVYDRVNKYFTGKIIIKFISEIVLACLIAVAMYGATTIYNNLQYKAEENENLYNMYISISDEYVNDIFGTPYIKIKENDELVNNFYILENAVLRTVSNDGKVMAYFVTSTNKSNKITVDSYETEKRIIGKTKYGDIGTPNPEIESNIATNGRYIYYCEIRGTGRYGMYNYYLYGTVPYGFYDEYSYDLISKTSSEDITGLELAEIKKKSMPNTFGVISAEYKEKISIIPLCDEWENMYHLLEKKN